MDLINKHRLKRKSEKSHNYVCNAVCVFYIYKIYLNNTKIQLNGVQFCLFFEFKWNISNNVNAYPFNSIIFLKYLYKVIIYKIIWKQNIFHILFISFVIFLIILFWVFLLNVINKSYNSIFLNGIFHVSKLFDNNTKSILLQSILFFYIAN